MRGCQKKMIYVRNTGSDIFDEAFFVLKPGFDTNKTSESDMIKEAKRILENEKGGECKNGVKKKISKSNLIICGIVCASMLFGSLLLIIAVI